MPHSEATGVALLTTDTRQGPGAMPRLQLLQERRAFMAFTNQLDETIAGVGCLQKRGYG